MTDIIPLVEVHCRGCLRTVAVGTGPPMHKLWCSELCANDYAVSTNEDRDSIIETLARLKGWSPTEMVVNLDIGVTRPRIQQILRERIG